MASYSTVQGEYDRARARVAQAQQALRDARGTSQAHIAELLQNLSDAEEERRSLQAEMDLIKAAQVERRRRRAAKRAASLPPEPDEGTVISFKKSYESVNITGIQYDYAAIRQGGLWYLTQNGGRSTSRLPAMNWEQFITWLGHTNIRVWRVWKTLNYITQSRGGSTDEGRS